MAQRSKIHLNIHRDDVTYFEWHRMVLLGIWQKALMVTEPCFKVPGLNPGEHYFEGDISELPDAIEWFLETEEGMREAEKMRNRAYETLCRLYDFRVIIDGVISKLLNQDTDESLPK